MLDVHHHIVLLHCARLTPCFQLNARRRWFLGGQKDVRQAPVCSALGTQFSPLDLNFLTKHLLKLSGSSAVVQSRSKISVTLFMVSAWQGWTLTWNLTVLRLHCPQGASIGQLLYQNPIDIRRLVFAKICQTHFRPMLWQFLL
jgi:hypothetical protein